MTTAASTLDLPAVGGIASWIAEIAQASPRPLHRVDPDLSVEILEHAVATAHGPRSAVSYLTRGLSDRGRPELVVTWPVSRLGVPSAAVIAALRAIGRCGEAVRVGGVWHLGEGALLEGVGLSAFVFVPAQAMPGLRPPEGAVHAVAVTATEQEVIGRIGPHRVLSRLGVAYRRFPWPVWSSPRAAVVARGEGSVMEGARRAEVAGVRVALEPDGLVVRVPRTGAGALAAALGAVEAGGEVAVLAAPDPEADGHLVWMAGAVEPSAVPAPGSRGRRLAGGFVRFSAAPAGARRATGAAVEDGFAARLPAARVAALRAALRSGASWRTPAEAGELRVAVT